MRLEHRHSFEDFRRLAKRRLFGPICNDPAAVDEVAYRRNASSFERYGLLASVLTGVREVEMSVTVIGQKLAMPIYCSPSALQRLFHHQGERAVAAAGAKSDTKFGVSSLGAVLLEDHRRMHKTPQIYKIYFHKDRGLKAMMARAKAAGVEAMMDSGIRRGTPVLKALSLGAKAVGVGPHYLYPLAAAGQRGVERALGLLRAEIERDVKLMGVTRIDQFGRRNLRFHDNPSVTRTEENT